MPDGATEINAQIRLGGLGDLEGDERTLSQGTLDEITQIAREDLRARYEDLSHKDEIHILAINSPNIAIIAEEKEVSNVA